MIQTKSITFNHQDNQHPLDCLTVIEKTINTDLADDEVLIKVEGSVFNHSDMGKIGGLAKAKVQNFVPGNEGTGRVVETGSSALSRSLMNQRVSAYSPLTSGFWSEYVVVKSNDCHIIDEDIDLMQAASFALNPATALGIIDHIKQLNQSCMMHTAGMSQVGRMLIGLGKQNNIKVINCVRRHEQKLQLDTFGSDETIVLSKDDSMESIKESLQANDCNVVFDAIAGQMTVSLLDVIPQNGHVFLYGVLSSTTSDPTIHIKNLISLIYGNKSLHGYIVSNWLSKQSMPDVTQRIHNGIRDGVINTSYHATADLYSAKDHIKRHCLNTSQGKVFIRI